MTRFIPPGKWAKSKKRVCKTIEIAKRKKAAKKITYKGNA